MSKKCIQQAGKKGLCLYYFIAFFIAFGTMAVNTTSKWASYEPDMPESLRRKMQTKYR